MLQALRFLREGHIIPKKFLDKIERLRKVRNEVVHGTVDYKTALDQDTVDSLEKLVQSFEEAAGANQH